MSIRRGLENQRAQNARIEEAAAKLHRIDGRFLVLGEGDIEATKDVTFPVTFTEIPGFFFGGVLDYNQAVETGSFPTISALVFKWDTEIRMGLPFLYKGATIGLVITDSPGKVWLNWHMEGLALRNPIKGLGSPEETL